MAEDESAHWHFSKELLTVDLRFLHFLLLYINHITGMYFLYYV